MCAIWYASVFSLPYDLPRLYPLLPGSAGRCSNFSKPHNEAQSASAPRPRRWVQLAGCRGNNPLVYPRLYVYVCARMCTLVGRRIAESGERFQLPRGVELRTIPAAGSYEGGGREEPRGFSYPRRNRESLGRPARLEIEHERASRKISQRNLSNTFIAKLYVS